MKDLKAPSANAVRWRATRKTGGESVVVESQTWFASRAKAAALLGCEPGDLMCAQEEEK